MCRVSCLSLGLLLVVTTMVNPTEAAPDDPDVTYDKRVILLEPPPTIRKPDVEQAQGLRLVYVNFDGVTLTGSNSADDGPTNQSAIPVLGNVIGPGQTLTIPAFQPNQLGDNGAGLSRDQIISRAINDLYASHAPYNVEFVTDRPSGGNYSMVVIGGSCQSVAGQTGCGGIALLDCGDNMMPNNITFMFPPGLRVGDIASVTAQEAAHAFGLSHTSDQTDVMFPQIQQSIPTRFGAGTVPDSPNCGASFQDSDALMLSTIGPRGQDTIPPAVTITSPADGAVVGAGTMIAAMASDNVLVSNVEFLVDNVSVVTQAAGPFVFALPATATAGSVRVEVRATDNSGNVGSAAITITIADGGGEGNLGDICSSGDECDSRTCASLDGEMRCSRECSATAPCPAGFDCLDGVACWPASGGGCSVGGVGGAGSAALVLFVALLFVRRRRE